jgi:phage terminase large subunit-like protein
MIEGSPATDLVDRLVATYGKSGAHRILDVMLDKIAVHELAALNYDWRNFWARPKQLPPAINFRSWGFLTARGTGKTTSIENHIVEEVQAGRAMSIGCAAQKEDKTIEVQIGGLIDASPPWFRPEWVATYSQLVWPNGAIAYAHTPEAPGAIRSHNFDMAWLSEVQSWPTATRDEAYLNFQFATRIGYARTLWDATPKRRHPLLRMFLARAESDPLHVIVRGTIHENARNLGKGVIAELEKQFGGTLSGREELLGEMLSESESALVRQEWIDRARRSKPDVIVRRVIGVDPAITARAGSDLTGISDCGLAVDGQALVLGDHSGKHAPHAWAKIVLDLYVGGRCDLVVVETNRGGDLVTQNLRAAAAERGLRVVVVGKEERTQHVPGVVHVKEIHSQGEKQDRAQPVATAYERGRVSHVNGVDLSSLEDTLTTWEPQPKGKSPDDLDALVAAVIELLGLKANKPDPKVAYAGFAKASKAVQAPIAPQSISFVVGGDTGGKI